jgi:hypothetical protein
MVGDLAAAPAKLEAVAADELPAELQGLDPAARRAKVAQIAGERQHLEEKARAIAARRSAWLAEHAAGGDGDGFDARVMKDVRKQAASIGVRY